MLQEETPWLAGSPLGTRRDVTAASSEGMCPSDVCIFLSPYKRIFRRGKWSNLAPISTMPFYTKLRKQNNPTFQRAILLCMCVRGHHCFPQTAQAGMVDLYQEEPFMAECCTRS